MERDTHFGTVLIIVGLALAGVAALAAVGLQGLGVAFVGISLLLLLLGGLLVGAVLAWPMAYLIIAIVYWARPDPVAPSARYTLDMGREAGGDRDRRGTDDAPPPPAFGDGT